MGLTRSSLIAMGWDDRAIEEWCRDAPALDAEHADQWRDLGLSAEEAGWYGPIRPSIADDWLSAGFAPAEMVRCHRSRVTLRRAVQWRDAGRSLDQTIAWASFGFTPAETDHWLERNVDARSAHQIRQLRRRGDQSGLVAFVVGTSSQEPVDVPDDARDLEQELDEMLPHVPDPTALPEPWRSLARRSVGASDAEGPAY